MQAVGEISRVLRIPGKVILLDLQHVEEYAEALLVFRLGPNVRISHPVFCFFHPYVRSRVPSLVDNILYAHSGDVSDARTQITAPVRVFR